MRNAVKLSTIALLAALTIVPANAATLNLGGNGGGVLGTGLLAGNGSSSGSGSSSTGVNANLNLNGTAGGGNSDGLLGNLFGNGGDGALATVSVNGLNGGSGDVLGNGTSNATVTLGGGNDTDANILLDLFGANGSSGAGNGSGDTAADAAVNIGGVLPNLFGDGGILPTGGTSGGGTGGTGGAGGTSGGGTGGLQVASLTGADLNCFAPNASQANTLASRHAYTRATFSSWAGASSIRIVDAGVCPASLGSLSQSGNIAALQAFVAASPALNSALSQQGHSASEVIGIDRQGNTLIVYVA
ncbi:MAG: hypothetical protein ABI697_09450 [Devosia sp.]